MLPAKLSNRYSTADEIQCKLS